MNEFFTCLVSKNGMAYLTGVVIFLLTLFLASRKIIGFSLTFLFLVFALVASLAVSHQDLIRSYFVHSNAQTKEGVYQDNSKSDQAKQSPSDINADLQKAFDDLKAEFLIEKARLQTIWEDFIQKQQSQKKDEASPPPESK
jgi:hypothetical protein